MLVYTFIDVYPTDVHVSHLTSKKSDSAGNRHMCDKGILSTVTIPLAHHNITVSITPKEPVPTKLHVK